jgi:hypothetical protein
MTRSAGALRPPPRPGRRPPDRLSAIGHAAWVGDPALVGFLLERGADPSARAAAEWDTPLAAAALGSRGPFDVPQPQNAPSGSASTSASRVAMLATGWTPA